MEISASEPGLKRILSSRFRDIQKSAKSQNLE